MSSFFYVGSKERLLGQRALRIRECKLKHARSGEVPLNLGTQQPPPAGSPKNHSPPEGPHDFRGHLRRSRKSDIAAEELSSADYATCRHAPRPKGEQRARGCVLCELRSALTFSPPVAARTSNKRPSCLRTPRRSECGNKRVIPSSKKFGAGIRTLRIGVVRVQTRSEGVHSAA